MVVTSRFKHKEAFFNNTDNVAYFSTASDFSANDDGTLKKQALVFVEGKHKDNAGREHNLSADRLEKIAQNTKAFFSGGNPIPLLKDHKKDIDNKVGDVSGNWVVRQVTEEDVDEQRYPGLVGKMGLFTDNVVIKSKDMIEKAKQGIIDAISPGLNFVEDTIKEISLTPMPAITGMGLFSETALTWEEMDQMQQLYEQVKKDFDEISEDFFQLAKNILDTQNVDNKDQYFINAINGYAEKLMQLFEVNPQVSQDLYGGRVPQQPMGHSGSSQQQVMGTQQQMMGGNSAGQSMAQVPSGLSGNKMMRGFSSNDQNNGNYLAAFSMQEMAEKLNNN